jgi:hypothetical protein
MDRHVTKGLRGSIWEVKRNPDLPIYKQDESHGLWLPEVFMSMLDSVWPAITNRSEAQAAVVRGNGATCYVAVVTGVCAALAIVKGHSVLGVDGSASVDAMIFAVVAWRLFRDSLPWAVFGLAMYSVEKIWQFHESSEMMPTYGFVATFLCFVAFVGCVRGTHFLRRDYKDAVSSLRCAT